jgi:hypothetical protein
LRGALICTVSPWDSLAWIDYDAPRD